ncbi:nucleotide-binding protein [Methanospirillum hungatei]|uniref:NOB1 family endonuclease n=1 Tax=Methanospirillum hungatei TaxID=2203 RepID=UPI0026EBFA2C|nr:nucleotide-binding protein [Methanospirillum hungatei]MCA1917585.1 nucleotide-binding protein [Methanospirillum hungatei]
MTDDSFPVLILDTSAFFISIPVTGKIMTVPRVIAELKDLKGKARLEVLLSQGLIISEPDQKSLMIVRNAATKSGDGSVLSETDTDLLALAFEVHGVICTDDFALQNTAQHLNIDVHPMMQKKAEMRIWRLRCSGCGKYYDIMPADSLCPICGLQVRRKNK